jgi:hypothetical protein
VTMFTLRRARRRAGLYKDGREGGGYAKRSRRYSPPPEAIRERLCAGRRAVSGE